MVMLHKNSEKLRQNKRSLSPARIILAALAVALGLKFFVVDLVAVRGDSMDPTMRTGSLALVAPIAYGIRNPFGSGFILRWASPAEGQLVLASAGLSGSVSVIKRVLERGPAWLSTEAGVLSSACFSVPLEADARLRYARGLYLLPGMLFLVGDNPDKSLDSREYGPVSDAAVRGRVVLVLGSGGKR